MIELLVLVWLAPAAALLLGIYTTQRDAFKAVRTRYRWKLALWCLRWPLVAYQTVLAAAAAELERLKRKE